MASDHLKKADILSDAPIFSRYSNIKKPRSVIMLSLFPQSASFSEQIRGTISLSEIDSDHEMQIKLLLELPHM